MNFSSDNSYGAPDAIIEALNAVNGGAQRSYGADEATARVRAALSDLFEKDVDIWLVPTGTAANALAISCMTPTYGAVLTYKESHVMEDECGAVEFYTGGAKVYGLPGNGAKVDAAVLKERLGRFPAGDPHHGPPSVFSLTQATECGRVYSLEEIAALAEAAHDRGASVHMDGARFANALVALGCTPAEMTWKAGVDALSFGATKNGCMTVEAIVSFGRIDPDEMDFRRTRAGHRLSKGRFMAAQMEAYLGEDLWLKLASRANEMARRLSNGLAKIPGITLAWPTEANEVFAILPRPYAENLLAEGAVFYEWPGRAPEGYHPLPVDQMLCRFVCSFAMDAATVDNFLALARKKQSAPA